jgi:D-amino-acid dehydrogenase
LDHRHSNDNPAGGGDVVVIGAGIVGLSSALELAARGRRVVVVDRRPIDGGCAAGSAGHLVPSHVVPFAAPGALASSVGDLIRRDGALSVRWTVAPGLWRWIGRFARSCTARSVATAAPALAELAELSTAIWDGWLDGAGHYVAADGLLDVYAGRRRFDAAARHAEELQRWGVAVRLLDGPEAQVLEPALIPPVAGGVLLVDDRSIDPAQALAELVARVRAAGVVIRPHVDVVGFRTENSGHRPDPRTSGHRPDPRSDRVRAVSTTGGDLVAGQVVLAAGAWSGTLARQLGERVPTLPARGLSVTVDRPDVGPRRAMLLGEDHVAVAPMGDELRLSAWFGLNDFDTDPAAGPIARLEAIARTRIRLDPSLAVRQRWAGLRPVTPDGVPVIGRSTRWSNVTIATGHAMVGLTLGPGTGRLVAQLVCEEPQDIDIDRFSPRRFA